MRSQRDEKLRTRSITLLAMCFVVVVLMLDVACSSPSSPSAREAEPNSSAAKQSAAKQSVAGETVEPSSTANEIQPLSIKDLPNVVAQHRGSFVLVDLWALW